MSRIRALIARLRSWWWLRRHPEVRRLHDAERAERRRRAAVIAAGRFRWPPRAIRRAIPKGEKGRGTRRGRKAQARITRIAAKYGVVVHWRRAR